MAFSKSGISSSLGVSLFESSRKFRLTVFWKHIFLFKEPPHYRKFCHTLVLPSGDLLIYFLNLVFSVYNLESKASISEITIILLLHESSLKGTLSEGWRTVL